MKRGATTLYAEPTLPRWWNILIASATVGAICVLTVDIALYYSSSTVGLLRRIDLGLSLLFLADLVLKMARSQRPLAVLAHDAFDLLAVVPAVALAYLGPLAWLVRLLRLLSLARRVARRLHIPVEQNLAGFLGALTFTVWFATATAFYLVERGANDKVVHLEDAFWWSIVTLSTVGYGDISPMTHPGRVVAMVTMVLGIGVLGAFAGALSSTFVSARERGRRGLGSISMKGHLLVIGNNDKTAACLAEFRLDRRYEHAEVVHVVDTDLKPLADPTVSFIAGKPTRRDVLERASAAGAGAAILFARDPHDPRSDHETILTVQALRALNPTATISAELVDADNREALEHAGCDAVVHTGTLASGLLARGVQDEGVVPLFRELLTNKERAEVYRATIDDKLVGKTYRDLAISMLDHGRSLVAIGRGSHIIINPPASTHIEAGDVAFVIAHEPP